MMGSLLNQQVNLENLKKKKLKMGMANPEIKILAKVERRITNNTNVTTMAEFRVGKIIR
jgi:hypothetical protein